MRIYTTDTLIFMKVEQLGEALSKQTVNIIRTTQRNNIDLTAIADGKANVLLSLNALMLTFLIPTVGANLDMIVKEHLYVPLTILAFTCFLTVYMSTLVLRPSNFEDFVEGLDPEMKFSPFFFGNFYKMEPNEFFDYLKESASRSDMVRAHLAQDLYFVGKRLGKKMAWIRQAFDIFLIGLFLTLVSTGIVLVFF